MQPPHGHTDVAECHVYKRRGGRLCPAPCPHCYTTGHYHVACAFVVLAVAKKKCERLSVSCLSVASAEGTVYYEGDVSSQWGTERGTRMPRRLTTNARPDRMQSRVTVSLVSTARRNSLQRIGPHKVAALM